MSKLFRSNLENLQKKQTWWFVTFIAHHRTPQDETTGYVQESMERASHHVDMKQNSVVFLRCDDVSLGSLRQLEETAAWKRKRKSLHVSCSHPREKRLNRHFRVVVVQ